MIYWKEYSTYEEARSYCDGYEDPVLIDEVSNVTAQIQETCLDKRSQNIDFYSNRYFLGPALAGIGTTSMNVIDFGGACGNHYFNFKSLVGDRLKLNWRVIETEGTAKAGKKFENDELSFFGNCATMRLTTYKRGLIYAIPVEHCSTVPNHIKCWKNYWVVMLNLFR